MGKLFEILAVEANHEGVAKKLLSETTQTFKNKENLFGGKLRTLNMFDTSPEKAVEMKAVEAKERTEIKISSTVPDSMNYLGCILADYYDVVYQKEATNQLAKQDIIIDGVVIIKDVPVTFLLSMENRLKDLRNVVLEIPTLAPGKFWTPDGNYGRNVHRTPEEHNLKTAKDIDFRIAAPATDKHPAQVVQTEAVRNIGQYTDVTWSGLITSADKAMLLERTDKMLQAVKRARGRANTQEAINDKVGDKILGFIIGSWFDRSRMNTEASM